MKMTWMTYNNARTTFAHARTPARTHVCPHARRGDQLVIFQVTMAVKAVTYRLTGAVCEIGACVTTCHLHLMGNQ